METRGFFGMTLVLALLVTLGETAGASTAPGASAQGNVYRTSATYSVTVSTAAADLEAEYLPVPYSWPFTTRTEVMWQVYLPTIQQSSTIKHNKWRF